MRKISGSAAGTLLLAAPAFAADLGVGADNASRAGARVDGFLHRRQRRLRMRLSGRQLFG
jgi:hypothetical protein